MPRDHLIPHITEWVRICIGGLALIQKRRQKIIWALGIRIMENQEEKVGGKAGKIGGIKDIHGDGNKTYFN